MAKTAPTILADVVSDLGEIHGGRGILLAVFVNGEKYEAIWWVHPTAEPVLHTSQELDDAMDGDDILLRYTIGQLFPAADILNMPTNETK